MNARMLIQLGERLEGWHVREGGASLEVSSDGCRHEQVRVLEVLTKEAPKMYRVQKQQLHAFQERSCSWHARWQNAWSSFGIQEISESCNAVGGYPDANNESHSQGKDTYGSSRRCGHVSDGPDDHLL